MIPTLILFTSNALAWKHAGWAWDLDRDMPLKWYVSDYYEDSLDEDYQVDVLIQSHANWPELAPCAPISAELQEEVMPWTGVAKDYNNVVYYDDPSEVNDSGTLGVTYTFNDGEFLFTINGMQYVRAVDSDVVFSSDIPWTTTDDIESGNCDREYAIEGVATHEFGHLYGLGHSCEEEDLCTDLDLRQAIMYWSGGTCSTAQIEPTDDDVESMSLLYAPVGGTIGPELCEDDDGYGTCIEDAEEGDPGYKGPAPLEVCFEMQTKIDEEDLNQATFTWYFGNGDTSEEPEPCYTYEEKGQYSVTLEVCTESETCGGFCSQDRQLAYVVVCEAPEAAEGFDGLFSYEHVEGLVYQLINQADTTVYGCIDAIQWEVYEGQDTSEGNLIQSLSAWSPMIEFPENGTYTVLVNMQGPGGLTAEKIEIVAEDHEGEQAKACSAIGGSAGVFGVLVGLGAAVRRRRGA